MFRSRRQHWWSAGATVVAALGLMLSAAVPPTRGQGNPNPGIIPVNKQYVKLSAEYQQWGLALPVSNSPFFDETGEKGCLGEQDPGNIFFLASVFGAADATVTLNRSIKVPSGSRLLVPVLNTTWDNIYHGPPLTVPQLYEEAAATIALVTELHASVDGRPVQDLRSYRVRSDPFCYTVPATDNFYQFSGLADGLIPPSYFAPGANYNPNRVDGHRGSPQSDFLTPRVCDFMSRGYSHRALLQATGRTASALNSSAVSAALLRRIAGGKKFSGPASY